MMVDYKLSETQLAMAASKLTPPEDELLTRLVALPPAEGIRNDAANYGVMLLTAHALMRKGLASISFDHREEGSDFSVSATDAGRAAKPRVFEVWLDKNVPGVETTRETLEMPGSSTDAECAKACADVVDGLIGNEIETGWRELKGGSDG